MINRKINTVFIPVIDLKKSVEWYRDILGFKVNQEEISGIEDSPVFTFQMGETSLTLESNIPGDYFPVGTPLCNFHTDDIESVFEDFKTKGVKIESEIITFPDLSYFNFRDLNDNILMICTG